jgi:hypothetical protein
MSTCVVKICEFGKFDMTKKLEESCCKDTQGVSSSERTKNNGFKSYFLPKRMQLLN